MVVPVSYFLFDLILSKWDLIQLYSYPLIRHIEGSESFSFFERFCRFIITNHLKLIEIKNTSIKVEFDSLKEETKKKIEQLKLL